VLDGDFVTPPASAGCLLGVTRGLLLELAPTVGIEACERDLPMDALARASEVILTSTTREVQAVDRIVVDGSEDFAYAAPGPLASRLAPAFAALVARDLDP
ncbi:MAG TPA: aminotransferase class IV, partial [Acidimicrobiia bacterium]|nr:aminotransferase class IV [Acidimicrobiia bacterium]